MTAANGTTYYRARAYIYSGEAVARLARAVCAEHVPRALRGLKTFVADYRSA